MAAVNKLTQDLFAAGYTMYMFPNYVKLTFSPINEEYDKKMFGLSGGFMYIRSYCNEFTYKTGYGKHVKGISTMDMGYMRIDWCHENDNPVILCPFHRMECKYNAPCFNNMHTKDLSGPLGRSTICFCACHKTDEAYQYPNSIERINEDLFREKKRKYEEYEQDHDGQVCVNQMYCDEHAGSWEQRYRPSVCAKRCFSSFCPVRNRPLNPKKGNVYYDLKRNHIRQDGTLFDGEEIVHITKGKRYFDYQVSKDICEDFIRLQADNIYKDLKLNNRKIGHSYKAEILNIRVESRASRDLEQDLSDIKAGITVIHETDILRKRKENKKERLEQSRKQR